MNKDVITLLRFPILCSSSFFSALLVGEEDKQPTLSDVG